MAKVSVDPGVTDDESVAAVLARVDRVAVLGVSDRFTRPSFHVAAYLLDRTEWDVALVNPHVVETLGRLCAPSLVHLPHPPDLVVVFRHPRAWSAVLDEAAAAGAPAVWLPTGTDPADNLDPNPVPTTRSGGGPVEAAARGRILGLTVVTGRDVRADHRRWCSAPRQTPVRSTANDSGGSTTAPSDTPTSNGV